MKPFHLMLSMMALAACDRPAKVEPPVESEAAPLVVEGKPGAVERFEKAARKCGLARLAMSRTGADGARLTISGLPPEPPGPGDALSCALAWLHEHPGDGLRLVPAAPRR